jgi:transcriptional regulator with XRE-family HTH domain
MTENTDDLPQRLAENLSANLRYLRQQRGLTQARLAKQCDVPRSTLANLETGSGNPTLTVLARLSLALQVSIEEILSTPRAQGQVFPKDSLPTQRRGTDKRVVVSKLLPDPLPGMEFERMHLPPASRFKGVPHRPGTREYLFCESGELVLWAGGERLDLSAGDVAAFQGDQKHSYGNAGRDEVVAFSVVMLVPITVT